MNHKLMSQYIRYAGDRLPVELREDEEYRMENPFLISWRASPSRERLIREVGGRLSDGLTRTTEIHT